MDDNQELEMLREFYLAWVALHSMPRDKEEPLKFAAQRLVDAGHVVAAYRKANDKVIQHV